MTVGLQIKNLAKSQLADDERIALQTKLDDIRSQWLSVIPQSLKDKIIQLFREQTSSKCLTSVTCACCAESTLSSECSQENINDINLDLFTKPDFRLQKSSSLTID